MQMRLTENNIAFINVLAKDGVIYSYFVAMKRPRVSDCRDFINYENGKTVAKYYPFSSLPISVQKFLSRAHIANIRHAHKSEGHTFVMATFKK